MKFIFSVVGLESDRPRTFSPLYLEKFSQVLRTRRASGR
jgi:hypothetical protein